MRASHLSQSVLRRLHSPPHTWHMPASAGLFWLVCAGCVWFGVGWDSLFCSFICSIPSGGCSLVCGDARSSAGRSGFLLFVVLLDDRFDFLFGDLGHQWRDLIEAVSGLMPFDDHVHEGFLDFHFVSLRICWMIVSYGLRWKMRIHHSGRRPHMVLTSVRGNHDTYHFWQFPQYSTSPSSFGLGCSWSNAGGLGTK